MLKIRGSGTRSKGWIVFRWWFRDCLIEHKSETVAPSPSVPVVFLLLFFYFILGVVFVGRKARDAVDRLVGQLSTILFQRRCNQSFFLFPLLRWRGSRAIGRGCSYSALQFAFFSRRRIGLYKHFDTQHHRQALG